MERPTSEKVALLERVLNRIRENARDSAGRTRLQRTPLDSSRKGAAPAAVSGQVPDATPFAAGAAVSPPPVASPPAPPVRPVASPPAPPVAAAAPPVVSPPARPVASPPAPPVRPVSSPSIVTAPPAGTFGAPPAAASPRPSVELPSFAADTPPAVPAPSFASAPEQGVKIPKAPSSGPTRVVTERDLADMQRDLAEMQLQAAAEFDVPSPAEPVRARATQDFFGQPEGSQVDVGFDAAGGAQTARMPSAPPPSGPAETMPPEAAPLDEAPLAATPRDDAPVEAASPEAMPSEAAPREAALSEIPPTEAMPSEAGEPRAITGVHPIASTAGVSRQAPPVFGTPPIEVDLASTIELPAAELASAVQSSSSEERPAPASSPRLRSSPISAVDDDTYPAVSPSSLPPPYEGAAAASLEPVVTESQVGVRAPTPVPPATSVSFDDAPRAPDLPLPPLRRSEFPRAPAAPQPEAEQPAAAAAEPQAIRMVVPPAPAALPVPAPQPRPAPLDALTLEADSFARTTVQGDAANFVTAAKGAVPRTFGELLEASLALGEDF
jgi:hypothetical protein